MSGQATKMSVNGNALSTVKFQHRGVCDKCGKELKSATFEVFGQLRTFRCICACEAAEMEARKQEEKEREQKRRLEALFRQSKLGKRFKDAIFENFVVSKETEKMFNDLKKYAENFKSTYQNTSILIFSKPGTGKTFAASSVVNHLVKSGISAILCVVPDLLMQIRSTFNDNTTTEMQLLNGLIACKLLVLDDLGSERHKSQGDWTEEKLFQIINARYNDSKATIFTTNCNYNKLYEKLGERTFARIMEMSEGWKYDLNNATDWRLKSFK